LFHGNLFLIGLKFIFDIVEQSYFSITVESIPEKREIRRIKNPLLRDTKIIPKG
jgi:hypothetical protein